MAQDEQSLRFGADGTFTIVHFTDVQDDQEMDRVPTRPTRFNGISLRKILKADAPFR